MVRTVINILSPIAALAVVWVSLQSFGSAAEGTQPVGPLLVPPTSLVAQDLLPELGSISQILATTATDTPGESVPESVTRLLAGNGAVLLIPHEAGGGL